MQYQGARPIPVGHGRAVADLDGAGLLLGHGHGATAAAAAADPSLVVIDLRCHQRLQRYMLENGPSRLESLPTPT